MIPAPSRTLYIRPPIPTQNALPGNPPLDTQALWPTKDPGSVWDFTADYSQWLGEISDTIQLPTVALTISPDDLTATVALQTPTALTWYFSGGTAGTTYSVRVAFSTTTYPEALSFALWLPVQYLTALETTQGPTVVVEGPPGPPGAQGDPGQPGTPGSTVQSFTLTGSPPTLLTLDQTTGGSVPIDLSPALGASGSVTLLALGGSNGNTLTLSQTIGGPQAVDLSSITTSPDATLSFGASNGTTAGVTNSTSVRQLGEAIGQDKPLSWFENNAAVSTVGIFRSTSTAGTYSSPTINPTAIWNAAVTYCCNNKVGLIAPGGIDVISADIVRPMSGDLIIRGAGRKQTYLLGAYSSANSGAILTQTDTTTRNSGTTLVRGVTIGRRAYPFYSAFSGLPATDLEDWRTVHCGDATGFTPVFSCISSSTTQSTDGITLYLDNADLGSNMPVLNQVVTNPWYSFQQSTVATITTVASGLALTLAPINSLPFGALGPINYTLQTRSQVPVILTGVPGTVLTNAQAIDQSGNIWNLYAWQQGTVGGKGNNDWTVTSQSITFPQPPGWTGPTIAIPAVARAVNTGFIDVPVGRLTGINTPQAGWLGITNTWETLAGPTVFNFYAPGTTIPKWSGDGICVPGQNEDYNDVRIIGLANGLGFNIRSSRTLQTLCHHWAGTGQNGQGAYRFTGVDSHNVVACQGASGDDFFQWVQDSIKTPHGVPTPGNWGDLPMPDCTVTACTNIYGLQARLFNIGCATGNGSQVWSFPITASAGGNSFTWAAGAFPTNQGASPSQWLTGNAGGSMNVGLHGYIVAPGTTFGTLVENPDTSGSGTLIPGPGYTEAFILNVIPSNPINVFNGPSLGAMRAMTVVNVTGCAGRSMGQPIQMKNGDSQNTLYGTFENCQFDNMGNINGNPNNTSMVQSIGGPYGGCALTLSSVLLQWPCSQAVSVTGRNPSFVAKNVKQTQPRNAASGGTFGNVAWSLGGVECCTVDKDCVIFSTPGGGGAVIGVPDANDALQQYVQGWTKDVTFSARVFNVASGSYAVAVRYSSRWRIVGTHQYQFGSGGTGKGVYYDYTATVGYTLGDGTKVSQGVIDDNDFTGLHGININVDGSVTGSYQTAYVGDLNIAYVNSGGSTPYPIVSNRYGHFPTSNPGTGTGIMWNNAGTLVVA